MLRRRRKKILIALNIKHILEFQGFFLFTVLGYLRNHFILLLKQKVLLNRKNQFQCCGL